MNSFFEASLFAGVALSLITYQLGTAVKKKLKLAIFNPLLISIAIIILILIVGKVDYEVYNKGANILSWMLTPATVCLAIPLYEQWSLLMHNKTAVIVGLLTGTITSLTTIFALSLIFGLSHTEYVTLLPKSITTAIGIALSDEMGGYSTITVTSIVLTGVLGNMTGEAVCKIFRINEPISRGLAIGAASHAMGTAKAMEMGEIEGAMSSLAIAVSGVLTVLFASLYAGLI
ncbi:MAG: LrgB family protein [Eubacteriaceae bacterium]|nr:LrgB family protein [Eubacteriaceae bacterium]